MCCAVVTGVLCRGDVCGGVLCCRQAWLALGDLSKEAAMAGFIEHIDQFCPMFKAYIEAHRAEKEEQERRRWVSLRTQTCRNMGTQAGAHRGVWDG